MEEALCLDVVTQALAVLVVGLGKALEQGPTAGCRQYGMLFSVGSTGKAVLSWGKKRCSYYLITVASGLCSSTVYTSATVY